MFKHNIYKCKSNPYDSHITSVFTCESYGFVNEIALIDSINVEILTDLLDLNHY